MPTSDVDHGSETELQPGRRQIAAGYVLYGSSTMFVLSDGISVRGLPLGTSYAIWTGIGAVGTVLIGAFAFGDPLGPVRVLLLTGLVAAMIGLKLVGGREPAKSGASPEQ